MRFLVKVTLLHYPWLICDSYGIFRDKNPCILKFGGLCGNYMMLNGWQFAPWSWNVDVVVGRGYDGNVAPFTLERVLVMEWLFYVWAVCDLRSCCH